MNIPRRGASVFPRDIFGILLAAFIIGSLILFGKGHLLILGVLLTGCYGLYFLMEKKMIPSEILIYFIWVTWSLSGYVVSADKELFSNSLMLVIQIGIMVFAVAGITMQRGSIGTNFLALIVGGTILIALSYASGGFGDEIGRSDNSRMQGITFNPNYFAYILLMVIIASLYFIRRYYSWFTLALMISLIAVSSFGILFSASRKAFIGLLVLIPLWMWVCYRKEVLSKKYYFIAFLVAFFGLAFLTDYMLSNTFMGKRFEIDFVDNPIHQRSEEHVRVSFYREGYEMITSNPVFGIGLGNFEALSRSATYSHSDYIEVAASTGIVGFMLYFSIYLLLWKRLSEIQRHLDDKFILYDIRLLKITILIVLLLAFGRPNVYSQLTWIIIASAIGYSWYLKKELPAIRKSGHALTSKQVR